MGGILLRCRRKAENFVLGVTRKRNDLVDRELSRGERARLVKDEAVRLCERLEVLAALDEHALTRRRADARKVGERHGYHDRAGTGRDQHDQRVVNPLREAAQAEQGREKRDQERQADHDRRIDRREPRDQLFALSLARRRVLDNLQDARGSAVACRLCRAYFQQAVAVHAAAEYLVALFHRYGQALACQGGVIDRGRSLDDDAVKRNPRVRLDKHRRADRDAFRRDLGFRSV